MLVLKPFEACKYKNICPYSSNCLGLNPKRDSEFKCEYIYFDNGNPYFPTDDKYNKNEFDVGIGNKKLLHG